MTMTPTIGRIVHYYQGDREALLDVFELSGKTVQEQDLFVQKHGRDARGRNGQRVHAALITQVWTPECVNLVVFFGDGMVAPRNSVSLIPDVLLGEDVHCESSGWRWPPAPAAAVVAR